MPAAVNPDAILRDIYKLDAAIVGAIMEVANEHLAWCIRQGQALHEVFECLRLPMPAEATWQDALIAIALHYDLGAEIRSRALRWRVLQPRRAA